MRIDRTLQTALNYYKKIEASKKQSSETKDVYETSCNGLELFKVTPKELFLIDGFDFDSETIELIEKVLKSNG